MSHWTRATVLLLGLSPLQVKGFIKYTIEGKYMEISPKYGVRHIV